MNEQNPETADLSRRRPKPDALRKRRGDKRFQQKETKKKPKIFFKQKETKVTKGLDGGWGRFIREGTLRPRMCRLNAGTIRRFFLTEGNKGNEGG